MFAYAGRWFYHRSNVRYTLLCITVKQMNITRTDIERLFRVNDVIASGGGKIEFCVTEILDDRIRVRSTSSSKKDRLWFHKLAVVLETFDSIDPNRIHSSIVDIYNSRKINFTQNETYLYGFAREYRKRAGVATLQDYESELEDRVKYSKSLSRIERLARIKATARLPQKVLVTTVAYRRSADVIAEVMQRANGVCEHCHKNAPFCRRDGQPYLEVHHVIQLAQGGEDTVDNAVAVVCPNCHRRAHYA